jgi:uncharacterized membrane protein
MDAISTIDRATAGLLVVALAVAVAAVRSVVVGGSRAFALVLLVAAISLGATALSREVETDSSTTAMLAVVAVVAGIAIALAAP